jgi:tetratricopeptide (TPR) repeat protein
MAYVRSLVFLLAFLAVSAKAQAQVLSPELQARFQTAKQAEKAGDYSRAEAEYLAILKASPEFAEVYNNLGVVYYVQHKNREAISAFRNALKRKPEMLGAHILLALALARTEQFEAALPHLDKALALDPRNAQLHVQRARVLQGLQRDTEALVEWQQASTLSPGDVDILYELGRAYERLMTDSYQKIARADADSHRVHQLLGKALEAKQEIAAAIEEFKLAAARKPDLPGLHYDLANLYWKQGMHEDAEREFRRELELDPENYLAAWKLANTYLATRRGDLALTYLDRALALNPKLAQAHRDKGKAMMQNERWEDALRSFGEVASLAPDEDTVHYRMSLAYRKLGKTAEAEAELAKFQKLKAQRDARKSGSSLSAMGTRDDEHSSEALREEP